GEVGEPTIEDRAMPAMIPGVVGHAGQHEPMRAWDIRRTHGGLPAEMMHGESFGTAGGAGAGGRERGGEGGGPGSRTTGGGGPCPCPVEPPRYVEERYEGPASVRVVEGGVHIVYGPWQVVIRGVGPHAESRVVAVWHVHRSWSASANLTAHSVVSGPASVPGA